MLMNNHVQIFVGHRFLFLFSIYLGLELLGHMEVLHLTFWVLHLTVFQRGCAIIHSHQQCAMVPISPPPHQHQFLLWFCLFGWLVVFLVLDILVRMNRYLIVVLICTSLMTGMLSIFSCACCSSVHLLWRSAYLSFLSILLLGSCLFFFF